MDAKYDCKAVAAPCQLTACQIREIEILPVKIADAIQLTGQMDVEVILERVPGLFGADEVITNFREGASDWAATLILTAATRQRSVEKLAGRMLHDPLPIGVAAMACQAVHIIREQPVSLRPPVQDGEPA